MNGTCSRTMASTDSAGASRIVSSAVSEPTQERPLSSHITTIEHQRSGAGRGHTANMNEWPKLGGGEEATSDHNWVTLHRLRFPAAWCSITCIPVPSVVPITVQLADRRVKRRRKISDLARGKIRSGILSPRPLCKNGCFPQFYATAVANAVMNAVAFYEPAAVGLALHFTAPPRIGFYLTTKALVCEKLMCLNCGGRGSNTHLWR